MRYLKFWNFNNLAVGSVRSWPNLLLNVLYQKIFRIISVEKLF